ncbi:hypothetical protein COCC4DRAFT_154468 [Bipolaris maydis ATCC 48331]|uniref:BZIP domain-containing protein n=2 Tax=Cochliobolus heterostrophus TaxID=5016 RepID=M2V9J2_COCH5|nr:uncharacterized protein COCC4DRAFT_154468 [Bipolaris maydis ATCC 48331]EMD84652.1 hypothetical protein COCHEDRAFT_1122471 [Bipolaris maydis C5]KAJ6212913.1 hypothetical protein PSV09DRAFT_1089289 [Bipolaris maydis]EMD96343.1 hypothetical protein COCHEDRAFT_1089289 [Bipolaris maydis C5]ENH98981.1 hypothetical protein COCC4DRAFT_154468 [Bipolaris maydis ATCC 48331]KAJ6274177.1 hypothetical protein PSV08DRAFT_170863 [Bipolaris maydis]
MKPITAQLARKRERNRESQRRSRQRVKDQIDALERQNRELELDNRSLQKQLLHALEAIEVFEKGASLHQNSIVKQKVHI